MKFYSKEALADSDWNMYHSNVFPKQKQSNTIKMQEALSLTHAKNQPKSLPGYGQWGFIDQGFGRFK